MITTLRLPAEALQIEAVTSGRKNAAIEMKWADLLNMDCLL